MLYNEKGFSKFKVYLFFVFLFLVIHVGLKIVPMYMDVSQDEGRNEHKGQFRAGAQR